MGKMVESHEKRDLDMCPEFGVIQRSPGLLPLPPDYPC